MSQKDNQPMISYQTLAQNEAVETVLNRFQQEELRIPSYQRDADQWDEPKKSLFVESILNRLTVPAFYLATLDDRPDKHEVVDGQQRLTTLRSFFEGKLTLSSDSECAYFGPSAHYAGKNYGQLDEIWKFASPVQSNAGDAPTRNAPGTSLGNLSTHQ